MAKNKAIAQAKNTVAVVPKLKEGTQSLLDQICTEDVARVLMPIRKKASCLVKGNYNNFPVILGEGTTQLSTVKREIGEEKTALVIFNILYDLNEYFNVSRKMSQVQLQQLTIEIIEELWSYRLEEIIAFCHCFKKGNYIKVYERIDASLFWEAWALYEQEKLDYLHSNHEQLKGSTFKSDRTGEVTFNKLGSISGVFGDLKNSVKKQ